MRGARAESPAARANPPACDHPKCMYCERNPLSGAEQALVGLGLMFWIALGTGIVWALNKLLGRWL